MKRPETVTDDKGNIYVVPGQMTREEAEVYFPNQPERSKREDSIEEVFIAPRHDTAVDFDNKFMLL